MIDQFAKSRRQVPSIIQEGESGEGWCCSHRPRGSKPVGDAQRGAPAVSREWS